jgi:hypothetical protein
VNLSDCLKQEYRDLCVTVQQSRLEEILAKELSALKFKRMLLKFGTNFASINLDILILRLFSV